MVITIKAPYYGSQGNGGVCVGGWEGHRTTLFPIYDGTKRQTNGEKEKSAGNPGKL